MRYASSASTARSKTMKILKFLAFSILVVIAAILILLYEGDIPVDVVDAKYSNPSSLFITLTNESRIHYRDEGNRRGEPIILIHGFGASLHTWTHWVELLGDEFRVITLDLPAHGLTGSVPNKDYSTTAFVETVGLLAGHLELSHFAIGGNSMGGEVAWRYALAHPQDVRALLLVNSAGLKEWHNPAEQPLAFQLLTQKWFRSVASILDPYYLISRAVHSSYNNSPIINDDLILRYYHMVMRDGSREAIITRSSYPQQNDITPTDLMKVNQPTLILWGREDSVIDVSMASKFDEVIENSTLIIYEQVGHVPMEELPDKSADDVRTFMRNLTENP